MKTFKEEYETQIEPYLKQIDIFLKTKKPPYSISKTAELLHITSWEVKQIMAKENIKTILKCKTNFYRQYFESQSS